jgi:hypothetical protein
MDLLERYLNAVKTCLPKGEQDDIIRELSDDIRSQVEDSESELGRPLTDPELEALLKKFGHPMLLAARYQPRRHLIGPTIFPFYWFTLKVSLGIALVVHLALALALLVSGRPVQDIVQTMARFPLGGALIVFAWVTILYAAADLVLARLKITERWSPQRLPAVKPDAARGSRWQAWFELVAMIVFVGWWLAAQHYPYLILGPGAAFLRLAPVWQSFYIPILLLMLAMLSIQCLKIARPDWKRAHSAARLVVNGVGLVVVYRLLNAGSLIVWTGQAESIEHADRVADLAHLAAVSFLVLIAVATLIDMFKDVRRLTGWQTQTPSRANS